MRINLIQVSELYRAGKISDDFYNHMKDISSQLDAQEKERPEAEELQEEMR